ncbi:MAG: hypothetical protein H0T73_20580, partial [Ardenticatenales bacterium]|nr:hypothetical protein [Ardenticatenales bacterium]
MLGANNPLVPVSTPILQNPIQTKHLVGVAPEHGDALEKTENAPGDASADQAHTPPALPSSNGDDKPSSANHVQRKANLNPAKLSASLINAQPAKANRAIQRELSSEAPATPEISIEEAAQMAARESASLDVSSESAPALDEMAAEVTLGEADNAAGAEGGGGGGGGAAVAAESKDTGEGETKEPSAAVAGAANDKDAAKAEAEAKVAEQTAKQAAEQAAKPDSKMPAPEEAQPVATPTPAPTVAGATPTGPAAATPTPEPTAATPTPAAAAPAAPTGPQPAAQESGTTAESTVSGTKPEEEAAEATSTEASLSLQRTATGQIQRKLAPTSPQADPAFQGVVKQSGAVATKEKVHAPAKQKADEAAAAAKMPPAEKKGKAQDQQSAAIEVEAGAQAAKAATGSAPGFDKASFVNDVMVRIDQSMPQDPRKMENIESSGAFDNAAQAVDQKVDTGKAQAQGNVDDKVKQEPNTGAVAEKPVAPLQTNKPGASPAVPNAQGAAPKTKGPEEVEAPLQKESKALDQQMAEAKLTEEQLEKSNEPQFQGALASKKDAQEHVKNDPVAFRGSEQGRIESAKSDAQALEEAKVQGMHEGRTATFGQMDGLQGTTVGKDESKRAQIGQKIDAIYGSAKTAVEGILTDMDTKVDTAFSTGAAEAKQEAIAYIKRETQAYKDRRYRKEQEGVADQVIGWATEKWDNFTSMPDEYFEYFKQGRDKYTAKMRTVLDKVADIVKDHLDRAKKRIETGKKEIQEYIAQQPEELREIAEELAGDAMSKFDDLEQTVDSKREELVSSLADKYVENLQALDTELEQMKEADKGFLEKAKEAVSGVINTVMELKAMLESTLSRAAGAIQKIIQDPITFLGNLLSGVKQGLMGFVGNIGRHLETGL